mmetsp:Transcript_31205/g.68159  ORF Transcript_31205/g.68159 Transcript_31205/m.68159 type:complete len:241 (+) Transcript_31205:319-1041(+)|eukprot:CAMPEP_0118938124 /NCGR_PEP_ID=MMETSP1169-20130426/24830_1 /TAXON_ID=36882 /ORGANISM="Pyramimonas obovata, Strain CCMP722" /LENGTH=240 /DNA_ID=CAMNT_0006881973 /DNA_START=303 /DNA_END=1025 /DNA_ORIENTATION=+
MTSTFSAVTNKALALRNNGVCLKTAPTLRAVPLVTQNHAEFLRMTSTRHAVTSVSSRVRSMSSTSANVSAFESEEHHAHHQVDKQYEFSGAENQAFRAFAKVLMRLALANAALGVVTLCNGLIDLAYSIPKIQAFSLHKVTEYVQLFSSLTTPLATLYGAYLLYSSASSFSLVVTTQGEDIKNLMHGLRHLRRVFNKQVRPVVVAVYFASITLLSLLRAHGAKLPDLLNNILPLLGQAIA